MQKVTEPGKLNLAACIMLLVGAMIGSAIFSLSGLTILQAGPAAVLSWLIAGAIMLGYGLCMAELASRYPQSGGVYCFPRLAFDGKAGQWLGWISAWSSILTNVAAVAFSGIYVGIFLSVAFPWAKNLQLPLALASIGVCWILNLIRVDVAGKLNAVLVAFLLLAMGVYVSCAWGGGAYDWKLLAPFFTQGTAGASGFVAAIPIALIGYSGVVALAFMAAEVQNARRNIPMAMTVAILLVVVIYSLMILATVGLISAAYLQNTPGMRFIPMFAACFTKLASYPHLAAVISIAAVLALMTTMNVCVTINARTLEAAGRDGALPPVFRHSNRYGVPDFAATMSCIAASAHCFFPEYTQNIANFGAVFNVLTMAITMLSLIRARRLAAESEYSVPGGKAVPYVFFAILLLCNAVGIFSQGWRFWCYTAGFLLLGVLIYLCGGCGKQLPSVRPAGK